MKHRIELTRELLLTDAQCDAVDAHSFTNVATVLGVLLQSLQLVGCKDTKIGDCVGHVLELGRMARSSRALLEARARVGMIADSIDQVVLPLADSPGTDSDSEERRYLALTIHQVIEILRVRLEELLARSAAGDAWLPHEVPDLRRKLQNVLLAMAQASRGRFSISFSPGEHPPNEYEVVLEISSRDGETVTMPAVLHDVLRDLLANARKYTDPGGHLRARLVELPGELRIEVSDSGRGIPAGEMRKVIDFGYRAANAASRRSSGGGYGLTKTYWVVKRMSGRMWIESELGRGTTVICTVPRGDSHRGTEAHGRTNRTGHANPAVHAHGSSDPS